MSSAALVIIVAVAIIGGVATALAMRNRPASQHASDGHANGRRPPPPLFGAIIIGAVCLILVVLLSAAYTTYTVQQSQRQWCDTLGLLTSHRVPKPADPAANPSRALSYAYYLDFLSLGERFGCG